MADFLTRHHILARLVILWAMCLITFITATWAGHIESMTGGAATMGTSLVGIFGLAALNWRKAMGIER